MHVLFRHLFIRGYCLNISASLKRHQNQRIMNKRTSICLILLMMMQL